MKVAEERRFKDYRIAAIVLAAGGSTRMGSAKQILQFDGESLIRRATKTAVASQCEAVFVVVGAHANRVVPEIDDLPVLRVENAHWQSGMASSIRTGIDAVAAVQPPFDGVILVLADQPAVTSELLNQLLAASEKAPAGLVACEYAGTLGAPALFTRRHFAALRALSGDRGGKSLLTAHAEAVIRIPFAPAAIDLDTRDDYERALQQAGAITQPPQRPPGRDRG
jgi:molybdenum cofactor cytidylyltransferase